MIAPHRMRAALDRLSSHGSSDRIVIVDDFQRAETELTDVNRLDWIFFTALSTPHVNDIRQNRNPPETGKARRMATRPYQGGLSSPKS